MARSEVIQFIQKSANMTEEQANEVITYGLAHSLLVEDPTDATRLQGKPRAEQERDQRRGDCQMIESHPCSCSRVVVVRLNAAVTGVRVLHCPGFRGGDLWSLASITHCSVPGT